MGLRFQLRPYRGASRRNRRQFVDIVVRLKVDKLRASKQHHFRGLSRRCYLFTSRRERGRAYTTSTWGIIDTPRSLLLISEKGEAYLYKERIHIRTLLSGLHTKIALFLDVLNVEGNDPSSTYTHSHLRHRTK